MAINAVQVTFLGKRNSEVKRRTPTFVEEHCITDLSTGVENSMPRFGLFNLYVFGCLYWGWKSKRAYRLFVIESRIS